MFSPNRIKVWSTSSCQNKESNILEAGMYTQTILVMFGALSTLKNISILFTNLLIVSVTSAELSVLIDLHDVVA